MSNKTIPERLTYAVEHPFNNEESKYRAILVGGGITILSLLILPLFILFGFQLRVYQSALNGEERPSFSNIIDLFVYGLKSFVILIPVFLAFGVMGFIPNALALAGVLERTSILYILLAVVTTGLPTYLAPIFVLQYVDTDSIGGTYDLGRALEILSTSDYLIGYTAFMIIVFIIQLLSFIPSLFIITIPFIMITTTIISAAYLGDFFRQFSEGPDVENESRL